MAARQPKKFNIVSLGVVVALFGGGYYAAYYVPHWIAVRSVVNGMHRVCNDMYHSQDSAALMRKLLTSAKEAELSTNAETFTVERVPYEPQELSALNSGIRSRAQERGKSCRIEMEYTAQAKLPLTSKIRPIRFQRSIEKSLEQVNY